MWLVRAATPRLQASCLKIAIPEWLAGMLRIDEGDIVRVSNWDGKLRIEPNEANGGAVSARREGKSSSSEQAAV